jgi:hypothetical protein
MGNEWPPTDWTKASRADWDRVAEETCREAQEKFDRMSDEDWRKRHEEIDREWDGPISVSSANFDILFPDSLYPDLPPVAHRPGAMSRLRSWITKKLGSCRNSDNRPA